ncbi:hypothetical protein F4782DRAFT_529398 [Xylaria castorea]|nr:hypothetical protein F4782DRAFT_529398 [Xylaria castorea]
MPAKQQQQVFHFFGQLPTELRLQIWVYTWKPRTVTLYPVENDYFLRPTNKNRLPASAYVNSESRSETLRYYKRCFAQQDDFRWFNFRLDTLCIPVLCCPQELEFLDPGDLRKVQRLIVPETVPGNIHAETPCEDTWPDPVTESFESPEVEELLRENYPALREITLITGIWLTCKSYSLQEEKELYLYDFIEGQSAFTDKGWGHMRTTYIGGLKVRHTPDGSKSYRQRYCCGLGEKDVEALEDDIIRQLIN